MIREKRALCCLQMFWPNLSMRLRKSGEQISNIRFHPHHHHTLLITSIFTKCYQWWQKPFNHKQEKEKETKNRQKSFEQLEKAITKWKTSKVHTYISYTSQLLKQHVFSKIGFFISYIYSLPPILPPAQITTYDQFRS